MTPQQTAPLLRAAAAGRGSLRRPAASAARRVAAAASMPSAADSPPPSEAELRALASQAQADLEGTSLFLVGMMGSGKSTIGRLLAQRLGYAHLDTDQLIQTSEGRTVAQIFETDGEASFRELEASVLNEVASYGRIVVSTGGGIVERPANWGHLHNGIIIYLQTPVEVLATRVAADGIALRPLLAGAPKGGEVEHARAKLSDVLAKREKLYGQADMVAPLHVGPDGEPESPVVATARLVAALAAMLKASTQKERLRAAPAEGSETIVGGRGPLQI